MRKNVKKILMSLTFSTIFLVTPPLLITSCSDNLSKNLPPDQPADSPTESFLNINGNEVDQNLKSMYVDWYKSLTNEPWDRDSKGEITDYYSNSEQQSIALYANDWGYFWNDALHHQQEPVNQSVYFTSLDPEKPHKIRGGIEVLHKTL